MNNKQGPLDINFVLHVKPQEEAVLPKVWIWFFKKERDKLTIQRVQRSKLSKHVYVMPSIKPAHF